jgi:pyruvate ferredoxin oxidoreductase gamma subunit/2-oxoisovalerate ferredoxin oxidoreductase gamma subunit
MGEGSLLMKEIRFHGRGGQGAVIASWILAYGFFLEGKHAQAFPTFGAERRGAPVEAFVRMDEKFPNLRCKVVRPDYVIVMGDKMVRFVDVAAGIQKGGLMLINSTKSPEEFDTLKGDFTIKTLDVNTVAVKNGLGSKTSPFINTPILGAFLGFTDLVRPESTIEGIKKFVPARTDRNIEAFQEAYSLAKGLEDSFVGGIHHPRAAEG